MSEETEQADLVEWVRDEAMNLEKMLSGTPRLDFAEWKRQRDERARTVRGGEA